MLSLPGEHTSVFKDPKRSCSLSSRIWGRTGRRPVNSATIFASWEKKSVNNSSPHFFFFFAAAIFR